MAKTSHVPKWLPDWKDDSQYPDIQNTEPEQWAWEFLRRNPEYQREYKELGIALWYCQDLSDIKKQMKSISMKYCFNCFPCDPSNDQYATPSEDLLSHFDPGWDMSAEFDYAAVSSLFGFRSAVRPTRESLQEYGDILDSAFMQTMDEMEMEHFHTAKRPTFSMKFSLALPITPQLESAEKLLKNYQKQAGYKPKGLRMRFDKFANYLRVLDGRTTGESFNNIAEVLFPEIENEYPDWKAADRVKKIFRAAKDYRGYRYRNLLAFNV